MPYRNNVCVKLDLGTGPLRKSHLYYENNGLKRELIAMAYSAKGHKLSITFQALIWRIGSTFTLVNMVSTRLYYPILPTNSL